MEPEELTSKIVVEPEEKKPMVNSAGKPVANRPPRNRYYEHKNQGITQREQAQLQSERAANNEKSYDDREYGHNATARRADMSAASGGTGTSPSKPVEEEKSWRDKLKDWSEKFSAISQTFTGLGQKANPRYNQYGYQYNNPPSDARLKEADPAEEIDLLKIFADKVNNYTWHYREDNPMGLDPTVMHSGPMAQELLKVPGFESTVVQEPETGTLQVDTSSLGLATAGIASDLAKRVLVLEEIVFGFIQEMQKAEAQQAEAQQAEAQQAEAQQAEQPPPPPQAGDFQPPMPQDIEGI